MIHISVLFKSPGRGPEILRLEEMQKELADWSDSPVGFHASESPYELRENQYMKTHPNH